MSPLIDTATLGGILTVIGTVAVLAGTTTAYLTYYYQRKQYVLGAMLEIDARLNSEESRLARRNTYGAYTLYKSTKDIGSFTDPRFRQSIGTVRGDFDIAGALIVQGLLPEEGLLDIYWNSIIRCWKAQRNYVLHQRERRNDPHYAQYFEELANRAEKYRVRKFPKEESPEPYPEPAEATGTA
jgi:hypothetical protein